ncbi:LytTR family DNA-binding domain-containing protein [Saccharospirillum sp. MSK14-1]|uniref:LytR/AlgR family response regulator transcription factor n=1 Tax=Saccharospirillum sp. MSK14-1 TaxID=1897632 RepID=UPI001304B79D|nr:LytTR family DNA-binding domain-containing protein [Saccharospirillum sp. MSK14-1]
MAFQQHPRRYLYGALAAYFLISATLNTSIIWLERQRPGTSPLQWWEAPLWEYSSALSFLLLCPLLFAGFRRYPLRWVGLPIQLAGHFLASVLFCLCHVGVMVVLRKWGYALAGQDYQFGPWLRELFYEYQKDGWSYLGVLTGYHLGGFIVSRLQGEAHWLDRSEADRDSDVTQSDTLQQVLVKKLDKEFLVKLDQVQWLEANGNYVNLHSHGRVYPLRTTLSKLESQLDERTFCRVHRRYLVNQNSVDHLSFQPSGDGDIRLIDGTTLKVSRRYREVLRQTLSIADNLS